MIWWFVLRMEIRPNVWNVNWYKCAWNVFESIWLTRNTQCHDYAHSKLIIQTNRMRIITNNKFDGKNSMKTPTKIHTDKKHIQLFALYSMDSYEYRAIIVVTINYGDPLWAQHHSFDDNMTTILYAIKTLNIFRIAIYVIT